MEELVKEDEKDILSSSIKKSPKQHKKLFQNSPQGDKKIQMIKIDMISIKGGTFHFGDKVSVTVSDFSIGKYPVTQKQWKDVMGNNPSYFKGCDNCPVENVSWYDVQDFIAALNQKTGLQYRLPTETEWEYAARGGQLSKGYEYAGSNDLDEVGWCWENSENTIHPVGLKKANELGLHDMSGNVWEWCENDWHDEIKDISKNGVPWIDQPERGTRRVVRGGSWYYYSEFCRVAYRFRFSPDNRNNNIGFRLVFVP